MKKILLKLLNRLCLYEKIRITTSLTSEQIANCIDNFLNANARDYTGMAYPDGFTIAERYVKYIGRVGGVFTWACKKLLRTVDKS